MPRAEMETPKPLPQLRLAMLLTGDLPHVEIDHAKRNLVELPRVQEIVEDIALGALAVEL